MEFLNNWATLRRLDKKVDFSSLKSFQGQTYINNDARLQKSDIFIDIFAKLKSLEVRTTEHSKLT